MDCRPPCPSPTPRVYPNSCPLSRWCHPTISSSVIPFSCCLQSFPASGSFPMSQLFASGGQSIAASASSPHGFLQRVRMFISTKIQICPSGCIGQEPLACLILSPPMAGPFPGSWDFHDGLGAVSWEGQDLVASTQWARQALSWKVSEGPQCWWVTRN